MFQSSLLMSLLVLLFALPVLSAPTSPNDPFREITLRAPKEPEPPVCCLRPLDPVESSSGDDVFISFDDWKAKRLGEAREHASGPPLTASNAHRPFGHNSGASEPAGAETVPLPGQVTLASVQQEGADVPQAEERLSPHFRIPTTDRFNYASTDCSARVHTAHRAAKSPSSILSSKKDRYMLSPCAEEKQYIVVELCDDIMIDTVQLANYEFFSGVFKDFSVSVAKRYARDEEEWIHAGTYRAQNVRGVQSFHPPPTLRDFYRFIRIDFHSHYGNEYYCPLSLLRVYGLTHLEQWKWDEWESQSKARRVVEEPSVMADVFLGQLEATVIDPHDPRPTTAKQKTTADRNGTAGGPQADGQVVPSLRAEGHSTSPSALSSPHKTEPLHEASLVPTSVLQASPAKDMSSTPEKSTDSMKPHDEGDPAHSPETSALYADNATTTSSATAQFSSSVHQPSTPTSETSANLNSAESMPSARSPIATSSLPSSIVSISLSLSALHSPPPPPIPVAFPSSTTGGESIYRTIMNRLTALEANTTLYARYVEDQTAGIREVLLRFGEDLGRLEGIGKAQAQMYQRSVAEYDKHRRRLEWEHRELLAKVNHLTDEMVLEKRLGILQLCLLLAVLVFMALTRGSRGELVSLHRVPGLGRPLNMRDWGRRTLSLSGDWVNPFRSRSPTPKPVARPELRQTGKSADKSGFPSSETRTPSYRARTNSSPRSPTLPCSASRRLSSSSHTPSALRVSTPRNQNVHARSAAHAAAAPSHIPTARPQIARSASSSAGFGSGFNFSNIGPVPKSAKRWARTAHLHEVKSIRSVPPRGPDRAQCDPETTMYSVSEDSSVSSPHCELASDGSVSVSDVFSPRSEGAPTPTESESKGKGKQPRPTLAPLRLSTASDLPRMCAVTSPQSDTEGSEGDAWVDTDADGSEESERGTASTGITSSYTRQAIHAM